MRITIFLLSMVFSGCAYLKNESRVKSINANGWKENEKMLTYSCQNGVEIIVSFNKPLSINGSLYFLFGIVPIGNANFADKTLNLYVTYTPKERMCDVSDLYVLTGGEKLQPSSVWSQRADNGMCIYLWPKKLPKLGELSIGFKNNQECEVPPINVTYEGKSIFQYDQFGG